VISGILCWALAVNQRDQLEMGFGEAVGDNSNSGDGILEYI